MEQKWIIVKYVWWSWNHENFNDIIKNSWYPLLLEGGAGAGAETAPAPGFLERAGAETAPSFLVAAPQPWYYSKILIYTNNISMYKKFF